MPYLALVFNALVWGLSWWPLRALQAGGLHPVWATVVFFAVGLAALALWRPGAVVQTVRQPGLWGLALAAGATNAAFNWGVSTGEVVRVVLLFYLMPLWAVGLAWLVLGERITPGALMRVGLALLGALLVLRPQDGGWPRFSGLPDWLGLLGGLGFALTNVSLRRHAATPTAQRAVAMFLGGLLLPGVLGLCLSALGWIAPPPLPSMQWVPLALAMAGLFVLSNLALQYGAAQVPVNQASVVMLTEIVFAAASAVWLGGETLGANEWLGGGLILLAAALAAREP